MMNQFLFKHAQTGVEVWMKRLDLHTSECMGNKVYKLKYNIQTAKQEKYTTLLTFGGAYSNHIVATAYMGKKEGLKTIGIIRGEELGENLEATLSQNPSLKMAAENGMELHFISRSAYRQKHVPEFQEELRRKFGRVYILPEGGTNKRAVKGCEEILEEEDKEFSIIGCPVGTGGTISGIINASSAEQKVYGFAAVKADMSYAVRPFVHRDNWTIFPEENFGGFAKVNGELIQFINTFNQTYSIPLEPIYTGKMMYSLLKRIESGYFSKNHRILAVHTGGLQGISGMNKRLIKKNLPLIKIGK